MAKIDILTAQVAALTQAVNDIYSNAKKTDEFTSQSSLIGTSLLRVENSGDSEKITVNQILDKASSYLSNKLLYFNGVNISGNTVTLLAGSVWRVDSVVYSNVSNVIFNVPYCALSGDYRSDLILGGNSNSAVTKISGDESDIPIQPTYPNDKVVICELIVNNTTIRVVEKGKLYTLGNGLILTAPQQVFTLPNGALCQAAFINESPATNTTNASFVSRWVQTGNDVTLSKTTAINNRIMILYSL